MKNYKEFVKEAAWPPEAVDKKDNSKLFDKCKEYFNKQIKTGKKKEDVLGTGYMSWMKKCGVRSEKQGYEIVKQLRKIK